MQCPPAGMQRLREMRGNKCAIASCFETLELEFCHLEDTPVLHQKAEWHRGQGNRYYDILSHPFSYILLCHNHHVAFDDGEITLDGVVVFPMYVIWGKINVLSERPKELVVIYTRDLH